MITNVTEIIATIAKEESYEAKARVMRAFADSVPLKTILQYAYDTRILWAIPTGRPPFKPNKANTHLNANMLHSQLKYFKYFMRNFDLPKLKREAMFIELLENIHETEAELVLQVIERKIDGVPEAVVREVFPDMLPPINKPKIVPRAFNDYTEKYYTRNWLGLEYIPEWLPRIQKVVDTIMKNRFRYETVQKNTTVPWFVVGVVHNLESSFSFKCHLHNGDPLDDVTLHVPANRGPFDTWEESATDALMLKSKIIDRFEGNWKLSNICEFLERYNGLGYVRRRVHSPYLYSGSNVGLGVGKFISDGTYSETAVSKQVGAVTALKWMHENRESVI